MNDARATGDSRVPQTLDMLTSTAKKNFLNVLSAKESTTLESVPGVSGIVSSCLISVRDEQRKNLCLVSIVTPAVSPDHPALLEHAALRARARKSPYFLTWNLKDTALWITPKKGTTVSSSCQIKNYFDIFQIEISPNFPIHEQTRIALKQRAREILSDLHRLHRDGRLELVDIDADFFVHRLSEAVAVICPQIKRSLSLTLERDPSFREKIANWAVLQGIPADVKSEEFSESVSRQIVYRLLGKIIFYQSLRRAARQLPELELNGLDSSQVLPTLRRCFQKALEVDYHAVFQEDIVDAIPFPREASLELAALVGDLNTRDFANLPQDVVGEVFERLIPKEERHILGQYFTPENLVDIILAFCLHSANDEVLDPTCGTGTFMIRAYDRLLHLGRREHTKLLQQLWGVDIAPFPAELATINMFRQRMADHGNFPRIVCEDFFKVSKGTVFQFPPPKASSETPEFIDEPIPQFDAVVGNFPYISQDKIEKRVKGYRDFLRQTLIKDWFEESPQLFKYPTKKMQAELARFIRLGKHKSCDRDKLQLRISTYADIYVYLFFHAARFLQPAGRMGIVTSNAWIDVNFGYLLQRFFLDHFKIISVLESRCEPWFEEASVNTIVTVVERCDDSESRDDHIVKFVKVKSRLKDLIPEDMKMESANRWSRLKRMVAWIEACDRNHVEIKNGKVTTSLIGMDTVEDDDFRVRLRRQREIREEVENAGKTVKWGWYLRGPEIAFEIQSQAREKLDFLSEIALPKFGSKTRINEFFHVPEEVAKNFNIESEYLHPLFKSPKETAYITVDPAKLSLKIFVCQRTKDELSTLGHMGALKYIEWGETQTYSRGTFAGLRWPEGTWVNKRKPGWWALPNTEINAGQIFFSQAFGERHIHSYSPIPLIPDARLYFLSPVKGVSDEEVAAVLNSSITGLFLEVTGRVTMGDGALEMKVEDARDYLLVPKVQAFEAKDRQAIVEAFKKLLKRPIDAIPAEFDYLDRQELDRAVLKAMGLPTKMLDDIYDGLRNLVMERLQLGQMRSKARRSRPTQAVERVKQDVIDDLLPNGLRRFPEDFLPPAAKKGTFVEHSLPSGKIDAHISPLFSEITGQEDFKIELKSSFEAKFLLYAHKNGYTRVKMPAQAVEVSRAVKNYEIYLRELKAAFYEAYYKRTLDQQLTTRLTAQAFKTLGLPKPPE